VSDRFLPRVLRGYREIGSRLGFFLLLVALSAALGAGVALPLWLFATASPRAYTAAVGVAAVVLLAVFAARRIARPGISWPGAFRRLLTILLAVAKGILLAASLYLSALLAVRRLVLPAAIAALASLAIGAWIGYGVRDGRSRRAAPSRR